jgi:hypothetical protein
MTNDEAQKFLIEMSKLLVQMAEKVDSFAPPKVDFQATASQPKKRSLTEDARSLLARVRTS